MMLTFDLCESDFSAFAIADISDGHEQWLEFHLEETREYLLLLVKSLFLHHTDISAVYNQNIGIQIWQKSTSAKNA
jgi:hypothetical protein